MCPAWVPRREPRTGKPLLLTGDCLSGKEAVKEWDEPFGDYGMPVYKG
jgi:hypothetical protein